MLFLMKLLFGFCLDFLLPKILDNTGEQFGNLPKNYGNTVYNVLLLPPTFARDNFHLTSFVNWVTCQFLSLCVKSLSIKALCIEGNSDSYYNFIDK